MAKAIGAMVEGNLWMESFLFLSCCKPQGRIFQVDKDQHSINLRFPAEDVLPGYNLDGEEI